MGQKQYRKPYSAVRKEDDSWIRETNLGGVKEIQLKFIVRGDMIPFGCPCIPVEGRELEKRALQHEIARGDQFIKNAQAVTVISVGEQLIREGFQLAGFSHHWKETLHQRENKAIVECRFSRDEAIFFPWSDSLLGGLVDYAWFLHAYNNPGGIMTLNMVHPQRQRRFEKQIKVENGKIGLDSFA